MRSSLTLGGVDGNRMLIAPRASGSSAHSPARLSRLPVSRDTLLGTSERATATRGRSFAVCCESGFYPSAWLRQLGTIRSRTRLLRHYAGRALAISAKPAFERARSVFRDAAEEAGNVGRVVRYGKEVALSSAMIPWLCGGYRTAAPPKDLVLFPISHFDSRVSEFRGAGVDCRTLAVVDQGWKASSRARRRSAACAAKWRSGSTMFSPVYSPDSLVARLYGNEAFVGSVRVPSRPGALEQRECRLCRPDPALLPNGRAWCSSPSGSHQLARSRTGHCARSHRGGGSRHQAVTAIPDSALQALSPNHPSARS